MMRENAAQMTKNEKINHLNDFRILHPDFNKALKLIRDCHENSIQSADPKSVMITGDSGAGKTTLFKYYKDKYDETIHGETKTQKRILHASIPSPASNKFLAERLLRQIGDVHYDKGTLNNKTHRLTRYIKENGVELIMIDEFQHFLKPSKLSVYDSADWFKHLINETNVPVVLFGLEESEIVLKTNPQLGRRFKRRLSFKPFLYGTPKEKERFQKLLKAIDSQLPFEVDSELFTEDLSARLHYASDGLMDTIMNLIREAAKFAIQEDEVCINLKHLSWAFSHDNYANQGKENPFLYEKFAG